MKKLSCAVFCLAFLLFPSEIFSQEKELDVPYVASKPEVVTEMLRMANVGKDDILYDLGCGDGRIVITAAQRYGTRGVGVDIDPVRIKQSQENAALANVTHLVQFIEQDLFETDFHEATVVSLYLLNSVNLRLRPLLLSQLKPGTRVVSHNYHMDTWEPDQSSVVMVDNISHKVYLWIIPANVSGTWEWTWTESSKKVHYLMKLDQHFQQVSGKIKIKNQELVLRDVLLTGDKIYFTAEQKKRRKITTMVFTGLANGHIVEGSVEIRGGDKPNKKAWKATRNPATMKPLDAQERND
jgi:ubiquinone/menaquinone biosynthesis C-methylase UbiE